MLARRPAGPEESSERLVLTAEAVVVVVVVVVVAGAEEPRRPLRDDVRVLIHPRQPIRRFLAPSSKVPATRRARRAVQRRGG